MASRLHAGRLDALTEPTIVRHPGGEKPYLSVIVVPHAERPKAYWNVCKHLPIPLDGGLWIVPFSEGALVCNAHGAKYRPDDGVCTSGPCEGEQLECLDVEVEDGEIYVVIPGRR